MLHLPDVLTAEELGLVREHLAAAEFADGKLTATGTAREVKHNEQLQRGSAGDSELDAVLITALLRHPLLDAWAVPARVSPPLVNRHATGMHYGFHVDNAVTALPQAMRRDLSVTLFLDDPETYDGGELEVEAPGGLRAIKLKAGDAFIYATHALHQVREVTRGVRHAAVFWIQSMIADDAMRQSLFDLKAAVSSLQEKGVRGQEMLLLSKVHQNLTRRYARP